MEKILLSFLITILLYFIIPSIGSLLYYFKWRRFRGKVMESLLFPVVGRDQTIMKGSDFRFYGRFDALDASGYLWIKGKQKTISISSQLLNIYMLPSNHSRIVEGEQGFSKDGVKRLRNYSFKTLEEGTPLFVFGRIPQTGDVSKKSLSVIIHEEAMVETLIPASVFMGDVRSLWFNSITAFSWLFGVALFLILSVVPAIFPPYRFLFKVFISEALFPLLFVAPPGGFFTLLFAHLWGKGRMARRRYGLKKLFSFCEEHFTFIGQGDFECIRKICFEQDVLGEDLRKRFFFKDSLITPTVLYTLFAIFVLVVGVFINFIITIIIFGKISTL